MYTFSNQTSHIDPLSIQPDADLISRSQNIVIASEALLDQVQQSGQLTERFLQVSQQNAYYSCLIEGAEDDVDALYVAEQGFMRADINEDALFSSAFICRLHDAFYQRLDNTNIQPGILRSQQVVVGNHYPPTPDALPGFMQHFDESYSLTWKNKASHEKLLLIACAHHRLLWIHPFIDGNGRVARLHTLLLMKSAGINGVECWSLSKSLYEAKTQYMQALANADSLRRGDFDGRGNLSNQGLVAFVRFFLNACENSIHYA